MDLLLDAHVVLSFVGMGTGAVMVYGLLTARLFHQWTALFLVTTVLTSVTGYGIPATTILPSHIVGAVSLIALAIAIVALYRRRLFGGWRSAFVITATLSLYLNLFVGVVQAFLKIPPLTRLAPTQSEAPFALAQAALFVVFLAVTALAVKRFRVQTPRPQPQAVI